MTSTIGGIVWAPAPNVDGLYFPYFLPGERWHALTSGGVQLHPKDLLFGILLGYSTEPVGLDMDRIRPYLSRELLHLAKGFRLASVESMILSVAVELRDRFGSFASSRVLRNGRDLLPDSSPIRSDLITDLSILMGQVNGLGQIALAREIVQSRAGLEFECLLEGAREFLPSAIARAQQLLSEQPLESSEPLPNLDDAFPLATAVKF